jgi:hypothetical protein
MFMSINCDAVSANFLSYILDNLFSFCHKDGLLGWSIEEPSWQLTACSRQPIGWRSGPSTGSGLEVGGKT